MIVLKCMSGTLTYSPLISQNSTEFLRTNPCRYARYVEICPMNPLTVNPCHPKSMVTFPPSP